MLLASRSKSRQKVVKKVGESSKSPKSFKGLKNLQRPSVWRNVYQNTDSPSIGNKELELPLQLSNSFLNSYFAGPRSSLNTTFGAIIVMAWLIEPPMLCHVFFQRSQNKKEVLEHFRHLLSSLTLPYQVFVCKKCTSSLYYFSSEIQSRHFDIKSTRELTALVLPSLLQFWRCASVKVLPSQDQGGDAW